MPKPVNVGPNDVLNLDHNLVIAGVLSVTKNALDLTADGAASAISSALSNQETTEVTVFLEPTVEFADSPSDLGGAWAATAVVAGGPVKLKVPHDIYVKIPRDKLGVKPAEAATALGRAIGKALLKKGNANLTDTIAAQGTEIRLTKNFANLTADDVWNSLVKTGVEFESDAEIDPADITLYVSSVAFAKVLEGRSTLAVGIDPRVQAANLLGFGKIRTVKLPEGVVAEAFHPAVVATPKVLDQLRTIPLEIDWDFCRMKFGATVLLPGATRVVKAADAPTVADEAPEAP